MIFNAVRKHSLCLMTFRIRPVMSATYHSTRIALSQNSPKKSKLSFSLDKPSEEFLEKKSKTIFDNFTSQEGKTISWKWVFILSGIGVGFFSLKVLPHSHLKDFCRSMIQHCQPDGSSSRVTFHLETLIKEVMETMNLSDQQVTVTEVFLNSSDESTSSLGGYKFSKGFLLGFPYLMNYIKESNVHIEKMHFGQEPLSREKLESEPLKSFLNNLILSDDAKKFLIAREFFRGIHCPHLLNATIPAASLYLAALPAALASRQIKIKYRPVIIRTLFVGLFGLLAISIYFFINDLRVKYWEQTLDKLACELGPSYAQGGIEFYDKMLKRHIALRDLLPHDHGKKLYNMKGDCYVSWYREKLPISKRKEFCQDFLTSKNVS